MQNLFPIGTPVIVQDIWNKRGTVDGHYVGADGYVRYLIHLGHEEGFYSEDHRMFVSVIAVCPEFVSAREG